MKPFQQDFIEFALQHQVLKFGEFKLKSGRISPYFFNAGLFNSGAAIAQLGRFYAAAINDANLDFDLLFGPAYKGIPLAITTAIALKERYGRNLPYVFNRKEFKIHGEGGSLVGAPMKGRVLIVDDVITAGTAIRESMQIIEQQEAELAGVIIALDRQERGVGKSSAIQEIERRYNRPVVGIIQLVELIEYLRQDKKQADVLQRVESYRAEYGIKFT